MAEDQMKKEEKWATSRHGTVNFEKRRYPRVNVDLPFEYDRGDSVINHGGALIASEGGLLVYFPKKMEVGQILSLRLLVSPGFEFNTIEGTVRVVWFDGEGKYQGRTRKKKSYQKIRKTDSQTS